jgi:hypothetical protein
MVVLAIQSDVGATVAIDQVLAVVIAISVDGPYSIIAAIVMLTNVPLTGRNGRIF